MTEVVVLPEQQPLDNPERRAIALAERLGIFIGMYSQVLEDALAHATAPRPAVPAIAPEQRWLPLGPRNVGGRITAIAQDPTNPLVLYAGSAHGGLWQTLDGGDTWEHLGDDEHNFPVCAIAVPEQDPSTLYIGTGQPVETHPSGRGLYRVTVPPPRIPQPGAARPRAMFQRLAAAHPPNVSPREAAANPGMAGGSLRYTRIRMDPFDKDRFWASSQSGLWRFEPHPADGAARFILEFPPASIASGDAVPPLSGPVGPGVNHLPYATDVAVARDPRDRTPVSEGSRIPRYLVIYAGVHGQGVYRGRFDRQTRTTSWERKCNVPNPARVFARIQLALCEKEPKRVYALMDDTTRLPTPVYRSDDNGENWRAVPPPFDAAQNQAHYNLVLEVSPTDPDVVWVGVIDGYLSRDGGANWQKVLFSREYDGTGDYAQHADQHAAFFDRFERRKLWIGHDGGLSLARDLQLPPRAPRYWRIRSDGIIGSQFQDVAVNYGMNRGFMTAGGLQDNGGWMSLGGPTWIHLNNGDGAGFAFHPTNMRFFLASHQNEHVRVRTVQSTAVRTFFNPVVADVPDTLAPLNAMGIAHITLAAAPGGPLTGPASPFIPLIVQNPGAPNSIIFGWQAAGVFVAAYFSTNFGATIMPLPGVGAAIAPAGVEASAAAFGPRNAAGNFEGWVGFTNGNLALTQDAPAGVATPWRAPAAALPWGAGVATQQISGIAVHPTDERIVVVCTSGTPGRAFITYDRGTSWQELTARLPNAVAVTPANLNLPAGQRRQYTATANFADGGAFDATAHVTWTTTDPAIARFSLVAGEEGQLISVAPGMVTVTARFTLAGVNVNGTTMLTVTAGAGAAPPALPSAPRAFDLRALPPCPMTSLAFDQTTPTRVFIGTLSGVYVLPNIPVPMSLMVAPNPANIVVGEIRQLTVQCMFSDGVQRDVTTEVDWTAVPPAPVSFGAGPLGSQITGAAAGMTRVTARRGALSADAIVNVTAGAPPVVPPPGPPAAAIAPVVPINWQPFNLGLPLTLVNDITNVPGTNVLRVATFGRGVWDCDLAATAAGAGTRPRHRLFIRQTLIEDGLTYPRPFPLIPPDDPRLPGGTVTLDHAHAFDIRIDAPPFRFFDDRVDGVEFDERLGADTLVPQVDNAIYVQVLNAGREPVSNVRVHLYFRRSPVNAAPGPATPLPTAAGADLGNVNEFYIPGFEPAGSPADGVIWTPVGPARMLEPVGPAAPVVARFDWAPPAVLAGADVALLALCESPDDPLPMPAIAGPGASAFVPAERRCALRITAVAPLAASDLFIRAGIDDDGRRNTLAAAAATRSPDIFVVPAEPADPRAAFRDLLDARRQDRLFGNATNHLYVRVHNRGRATVQAEVEVMAVKVLANLHPEVPHGRWTRVGAAMVDVPANGWALAHLPFASPVDPAPLEFERKYYILVALLRSTDNADPLPDRTVVATEDDFRQFLSRQAGSDNVAARAVRWVAS